MEGMELVAIVIAFALIEYIVFSMLVGRARAKYGIKAPAITGDPIFERYYRVHQNTLEQLIIFIPAILLFGYYGNPTYAAAIGIFFLVGRILYLRGYVSDPAARGPGFGMGFVANIILLIAGIVSIAMDMM